MRSLINRLKEVADSMNNVGRRPPFGAMDDRMNMNMQMNRRKEQPYECDNKRMQANASNGAMDCRRVAADVYELGFVLVETLLYLDTHPQDAKALAYYSEMKCKYEQARKKYNELIGPLQFTDCTNENYWSWVATPMPWEVEG